MAYEVEAPKYVRLAPLLDAPDGVPVLSVLVVANDDPGRPVFRESR
ncbi:hypothetical protein [Streptomyces aurantiogriseus]|nr:hypothetical protein [Streptomyces aurantiogriseus]